MSGPDVRKEVGAIARRINGYKGRIKLDLAKLDTNFTTLQGSPASFIQLEQVRRHFKHVDSSVQLARELYITVMGMVTEAEWEAEWLQKSDALEEDMNKAERTMQKAERDYATAMKEQAPTPGPPGPGPAPAAKQQPKVDIHLQPDPLTEDSKATEYKVWKDGLQLWMNLSSLNKEKGQAEQREVTKEKERQEEKEQAWFKCERCGYKAKTKTILKKHLTSKHCRNINREERDERESENEHGGSVGKGCNSCDSTDCCEKQNCNFTVNQAQCKWCQNLFVEAIVKRYNPGDVNTAAYRAIRAAG